MPTVKYVANPSVQDATSAIKLANDADGRPRFLRMGSDPIEITDEEFQALRGTYVLEVVGEDAPAPDPDPVTPDDPVPVTAPPSRPVVFSNAPLNPTTTPTEGN